MRRVFLSYVEYLEGDGDEAFRHACQLGFEGLVCKRRDSPYRSGRQDFWIKLKCKKSDDFPIVAFVEKLGARPRKIASLYVGRWEGERLLYAGKVGTGYTETTARELREKLDPLIIKHSALSIPVKKPKATWLKPVALAEISFGGQTFTAPELPTKVKKEKKEVAVEAKTGPRAMKKGHGAAAEKEAKPARKTASRKKA